jgi:hypothetical protein
MDEKKLDEWASKIMGAEGEDVAADVEARWFSGSAGAAFVVLNRCASEGMKVKIEITGDDAVVTCGECKEEGDTRSLATLMLTAAYRCKHGG